jgi:hypothetical protein
MLFVFCPTLSSNIVHIIAQNSINFNPFNAKTVRKAYDKDENNAYKNPTIPSS